MITSLKFSALFFIFTAISSVGFCDQRDLDLKRNLQLEKSIKALMKNDVVALRSILSNRLQKLTREEALLMIKTISQRWKDLSKLEKASDEDQKIIFNKGEMITIAHWGSQGTQIGRWSLLKSPQVKGRFLRIGLLYQKGKSEVRQFIVDEVVK